MLPQNTFIFFSLNLYLNTIIIIIITIIIEGPSGSSGKALDLDSPSSILDDERM